MKKSLSPRQQQVLDFIRQYQADNGMPPVAREIAEAIGCRSKNSAVLHLQALQHKGAIRIRPGTARGIVLTDDTRSGNNTGNWQELAAVMYQAAGAYNMPERIMDLLSAAQNGEPFDHLLDVLPVYPSSSHSNKAAITSAQHTGGHNGE